MKEGIHPAYHEINVTMTDGSTFKTRSTKGEPGDTWRLDIDSKSHPAYTGGEQKLLQNDQVDKFSKRYGAFGAATSQKKADGSSASPAPATAAAPAKADEKKTSAKTDSKSDAKSAKKDDKKKSA